jgi:hypothetical protein
MSIDQYLTIEDLLMSLINKTSLHMATGFIEDTSETHLNEVPVVVNEFGGTAYVEIDKSGIYLSHSTLQQLLLMVELHQRRINTF